MDLLPPESNPPESDGPSKGNLLWTLVADSPSGESCFDDPARERPSYLSTRGRQAFYYSPAYRPLYGGHAEAVPLNPVPLAQMVRECNLTLKDGKVG